MILTMNAALVASAADPSWIERYAQESAAANQVCGAKDYASCRQHLSVTGSEAKGIWNCCGGG
jgi:hypothetical protein